MFGVVCRGRRARNCLCVPQPNLVYNFQYQIVAFELHVLRDHNLLDLSAHWRLHHHFHLHCAQHDQRLTLFHRVAFLDAHVNHLKSHFCKTGVAVRCGAMYVCGHCMEWSMENGESDAHGRRKSIERVS